MSQSLAWNESGRQRVSSALLAPSNIRVSRSYRSILTFEERECVRRSVRILGRLYGANAKAYRSGSPRLQIDQNGLVPDSNAVRTRVGMASLS